MGDGFLLLYKRIESGSLSWPRTTEDAADLTEEQFDYLMLGLNPLDPKIKDVTPQNPSEFVQNRDFSKTFMTSKIYS